MTQNFEGRPHSLERNYLQDVHRGQYAAVLHQVGCAVEQRLRLAHDPGLLILVQMDPAWQKAPIGRMYRSGDSSISCHSHRMCTALQELKLQAPLWPPVTFCGLHACQGQAVGCCTCGQRSQDTQEAGGQYACRVHNAGSQG